MIQQTLQWKTASHGANVNHTPGQQNAAGKIAMDALNA